MTSRREADRLVQDERVRINGQLAKSGDRVFSGDIVTLDGKQVTWETLAVVRPENKEQYAYIKYWKPKGVVCTTDTYQRGNIIDAVNHPDRIFPVGRLDKDSSGLILLTSDGRVCNAVSRASQDHEKVYRVDVKQPLHPDDLQKLAEGVVITTRISRDHTNKLVTARTLPCYIEHTGKRQLRMYLREGRNRQIRHMLATLGYEVEALHREKIMDIGLRGLAKGQWCPLDSSEMQQIRSALEANGHAT